MTDSSNKKQKTIHGMKGYQDLKVMKAAFMVSGGQTMAAIITAPKNPGFQGEQD
jgi:hypothetical protein